MAPGLLLRYAMNYICYLILLFPDNYRPEEYMKYGIIV